MKNYMSKADGKSPKKMQKPEHASKPVEGSPAEERGESAAFEAKEDKMPNLKSKLPRGK